MGRPKAELSFGAQTLFERTAERLGPQCCELAVCVRSAGSAPAGWPEIVDAPAEGDGGPLLGVLSALRWAAAEKPESPVLISPVDTPFLPLDLVARLSQAMAEKGTKSAVAVSGDRVHGLTALFAPTALAEAEALVEEGGERMLQAFHLSLGSTPVRFDTAERDPFFNINRPEDLEAAAKMLATSV